MSSNAFASTFILLYQRHSPCCFVFNTWILVQEITTFSWKDVKLLIFINIYYFFFVEKVSPELPDINQHNSSYICN